MTKKIFKWIGITLSAFLILFIVLLIIPEKETVKTIQPRKYTQYWEMSEGFSIAYHHLKAEGNSIQTPIVYLHGGPGGYIHSSIVRSLKELNKSGFDVYLYDQRGSGLSDRLPKFSDINFQAHIRDLDEIITQKIVAEKVVLMGQSFGANIAAHYSVKYPNKIDKMVLSSPGAITPPRIENEKYVDLKSVYTIPDSLDFVEPYNFVDDVDNMAIKPKAIVAPSGSLAQPIT